MPDRFPLPTPTEIAEAKIELAKEALAEAEHYAARLRAAAATGQVTPGCNDE